MGECDSIRSVFMHSQYLANVNKLLNSEYIQQFAEDGVEIMFFPHARFVKYLSLFNIPKYVKVPTDMVFQDILAASDMLITDFSSNTFEMAYMNKPTLIYIPDLDYVRQKMKHYSVDRIHDYPHLIYCNTLEDVITHAKDILYHNPKIDVAQDLFMHVDTNNTKRLVEWMIERNKKKAVKVDLAGNDATIQFVSELFTGNNKPDLVFVNVKSGIFPQGRLSLPKPLLDYVGRHPCVKISWDDDLVGIDKDEYNVVAMQVPNTYKVDGITKPQMYSKKFK